MEYFYMPNAFFAILHISLALMLYKSVVSKLITLNRVRNYLFLLFCYMFIVSKSV